MRVMPVCKRNRNIGWLSIQKRVALRENKGADEQTVETLRQILDSNQAILDAANLYWNALAFFKGYDVRSGREVIEAYRGAALRSHEGVIALARTSRELLEKNGEGGIRTPVRSFGP